MGRALMNTFREGANDMRYGFKSGVSDKHLSLPVRYKDLSGDDAPGTIEAIVSVFNNKDFAGEVVMPGAFKNSIAKKLPRFVWAHNWEKVLGHTLEAIEMLPGDPRLPIELASLGGLYVKAKFNLNTSNGKDGYEHLKEGDVDEFSIGYRIVKAHRVTEEGNNADVDPFDLLFGFGGKSTLYLDELDLIECSPVLAGMNDRTQLIGVKSEGPIVELVEQAAQTCGILLTQAKAYAESRTKEGRTFSTANYSKLEGFAGRLEEMSVELRGLLSSAAPKSAESESEPKKQDEPSLVMEVDTAKARAIVAKLALTRMELSKVLHDN